MDVWHLLNFFTSRFWSWRRLFRPLCASDVIQVELLLWLQWLVLNTQAQAHTEIHTHTERQTERERHRWLKLCATLGYSLKRLDCGFVFLFIDQKSFAELSQVCQYAAYHIIILMRSNWKTFRTILSLSINKFYQCQKYGFKKKCPLSKANV